MATSSGLATVARAWTTGWPEIAAASSTDDDRLSQVWQAILLESSMPNAVSGPLCVATLDARFAKSCQISRSDEYGGRG